MEIEEIRDEVKRGEYEISFHAETERYAEDITLHDIETVIFDGQILEEYPDDPRGPSCLILGYIQNRPVHIVCGYTSTKWIRMVTVYIPKLPKWIDEKTRAAGGDKDA